MTNLSVNPITSNMTLLETPKQIVLFSYATPVASFDKTTYSFSRTSKRWSMTTSRHINKWLNGASAVEKPQDYFDNLFNDVGV